MATKQANWLLEDIVVCATLPIGSSLFNPEAAESEANICISDAVDRGCARYAKEKEAVFVKAIYLKKEQEIKKCAHGYEVEFAVFTRVVMEDYA